MNGKFHFNFLEIYIFFQQSHIVNELWVFQVIRAFKYDGCVCVCLVYNFIMFTGFQGVRPQNLNLLCIKC